jgi:hypothetical protein
MATPARLITPDGKTIELAPEIYRQIQKLLNSGYSVDAQPRRVAEIQATYGKYAGKPALTQVLLDERKADLEREEIKLKRHHG